MPIVAGREECQHFKEDTIIHFIHLNIHSDWNMGLLKEERVSFFFFFLLETTSLLL